MIVRCVGGRGYGRGRGVSGVQRYHAPEVQQLNSVLLQWQQRVKLARGTYFISGSLVSLSFRFIRPPGDEIKQKHR